MLPAPCGQATLASHDERYRAVAWRCANERTFARFPRTGVVGIGVAAFIAGVGGTMWTVNSRVIIQSAVPNELLGRFNAASRLVGWGMTPIAVRQLTPPSSEISLRHRNRSGSMSEKIQRTGSPVAACTMSVPTARAVNVNTTPVRGPC